MNEVQKPWGKYADIHRTDKLVLKVITVNPKQRLSLQSHNKRSEFWVVTSGQCLCEIDGTTYHMEQGMCISIGCGQHHRLINDTHYLCEITELQWGICEEEDIIRYEDDYGRKN